jgi:hypothetical protein
MKCFISRPARRASMMNKLPHQDRSSGSHRENLPAWVGSAEARRETFHFQACSPPLVVNEAPLRVGSPRVAVKTSSAGVGSAAGQRENFASGLGPAEGGREKFVGGVGSARLDLEISAERVPPGRPGIERLHGGVGSACLEPVA